MPGIGLVIREKAVESLRIWRIIQNQFCRMLRVNSLYVSSSVDSTLYIQGIITLKAIAL